MQPKRLYKIEQGKMILGVCGGIAEYFNVDPSLVRIASLILFCTGGGLLAYIIVAIVLPNKSQVT
jgi:phage shock protein PspC (stress-responsive transcriptional regulator)